MLRLVLFCVALAALSLGVNWLLDHDGLVEVTWLDYKVETSVAFLIIAGTVLLILAILFLQLFIWLVTLPTRTSHRKDVIRFNRGLLALTEGFAAISTGDTKAARQLAQKTKRYLGHHQPLALLLDAQVAQIRGDAAAAVRSYTQLMENKSTRFIGLKGLLGEAQKTGNLSKAVTLAEETYHSSKRAEGMVPVLLELYKRSGQWDKALLLIESGQGRKAYRHFVGNSPSSVKRELAILHYMHARSFFAGDKLERALEMAEKAYRHYPLFQPSVTLIAQAAIKLGRKNRALSIIRKAWKTHPRPRLGDIYLDIFANEPAKKLLRAAEKLAALNQHHYESHLLVATAALKAEDLAKARNHLKLAMSDGPTARACSLMARIEQADVAGGSLTSANEWLQRAGDAVSEPGWVCRTCLHMAPNWELVCKQCNSMDSYVWDKPGNIGPGSRIQQSQEVSTLLAHTS